jgi:succinoglycan biosynthesis transport protein ExoP
LSREAETSPNGMQASGGLDLVRCLHLLASKAWVIVLFLVVAGAGAAAYLTKAPRIYRSSGTLEVEQERRKVVNIQQITTADYRTVDALKTVEQSLTTSALMLRVIRSAKLAEDPNFAQPKKGGAAYSDAELVRLFSLKYSVSLRRGTRLIDVTVEDRDPEKARALAQAVIDEFLAECLDQSVSVSKRAEQALQVQANDLRVRLNKSEKALQEFRENNGAVSLSDKQNIVVEKLKDLNEKATEAEGERFKLEGDMKEIQSTQTQDPERLLLLASVSSLPGIELLRKQIRELEAEFSALKERYLDLHPKYIQAESQVKELKAALSRAVLKAGEQIQRSYESARVTEEKFKQALADQEKLSMSLNAISIPYKELERQVETDQALYTSVLNRLKETNVNDGLDSSNLRIIDKPVTPTRPDRPRPFRIIALALFGALLAGVGCVISVDLVSNTVRSVDEAESRFGIPVFTVVPFVERNEGAPEDVFGENPNSIQAEAFRALRASISLLGGQRDRRLIMFTSAVPSEGKTFCTINYASALARQGIKTLLVDADLRRPRLSVAFAEKGAGARDFQGLTDCLSGQASLLSVCRETDVPGLQLIGVGHRAPKPLELMAGESLRKLLDEALAHFDQVVIDTPPISAVSESLIIGRHVNSICMVIRAGTTPSRIVDRVLKLLRRFELEPEGMVLNCAKIGRLGYQNYYYYGNENLHDGPQPME